MSIGPERRWYVIRRLVVALAAIFALLGAAWQANAAFPSGAPSAAVSAPAAPSSANAAQSKDDPFGVKNFNCADIERLGIDKQLNLRAAAIMTHCGKEDGVPPPLAPAGGADVGSSSVAAINKLLGPLAYGGLDVNIAFDSVAYPKVTQSETFVWGQGNTVVTTMNDSRTSPSCYSGGSVSTDGGTTWARIGGTGTSPFCIGHGTGFGDPTVIYNASLNKWYASFLAAGCGGQGIGVWESNDGVTWTTGACAHSGSSDDRQSHWVDNNPASPYYGRQYISWNNFAAGQGIFVVWSDNGTTWSTPVQVTTTFIRNVQLTGDLNNSGTVFIAGMNEGGGGLSMRTNMMYRSTNGGTSWTAITMGAPFYPPGRAVSGYFAGMYPGGYFRHMGWGQPAAVGNNVHYVYSMGIQGTDPGNMMYTRSTDNGSTWSAPTQLNTDTTTRAQFMGNLAANSQGALFTGWYDERETTSCGPQGSTTPCYRRWGRASINGGLTWQADDMVGDVISPLPGQPDPNIQTLYAGDYDYSSANGTNFYQNWTDGRTLINNNSQQDAYFDKISVVVGTATPTVTGTPPTATRTPTRTNTPTATSTPCPAGNYTIATTTATIVPGTTNIGSVCDDCITDVTIPFPFTLYNQSYTQVGVDSNGKVHFPTGQTDYINTCLPAASLTYSIFPLWDDQRTDSAGSGIFTSVSGSAPNRIFNIEWRTTYYSGGGSANYELRLHENPPGRFEVIYGAVAQGNTSATGGVQFDTSNFTQDFCNGSGSQPTGGRLYTLVGSGCGTPPTIGPTNTPTRTPTQGSVTATPTCPAGGTPGPWATAAPIPGDRYGSFIDANATDAFVGGGYSFSSSGNINAFHRYNAAANTWTALANVPDLNSSMASAVWDPVSSRLFVFGGQQVSPVVVSNVTRIYNPSTNTWSAGANMPDVRAFMGSAYYNGKMYLSGGYIDGFVTSAQSTLWEYDPVANTFTVKAPMPSGVGGHVMEVVGSKMYVFGGRDGTITNRTTVYEYDFATNAWTTKAPLPTGVNVPGSAVLGGKVLVFGGGNPFLGEQAFPTSRDALRGAADGSGNTSAGSVNSPNTTNITQVYDPVANTWAAGFNLTMARSFVAGTNIGTTSAIAVGGYNGSTTVTVVDRTNAGGGCVTPTVVVTSTPTVTGTVCPPAAWTTAAPVPYGIVRYGFAQVGNLLYVIGGVIDGTRTTNVSRYDATTNTWTARAAIPEASEGPACAHWNGKIYCAEGDTGNSFYIYDIATNAWSTGPSVPGTTDRYGAAAGAFNGNVYIAGGGSAITNNVQVYNIAANTWSAGTAVPSTYLLGGYTTVGQYLFLVGSYGASPQGPEGVSASSVRNASGAKAQAPDANGTGTYRLDMSTGTWATGPTWTQARADMALAHNPTTNRLYAIGGDTTGGGYFDSTVLVDELSLASWPAGTWVASAPNLPGQGRQANQAGFYSTGRAGGEIWSTGGLIGSTFEFTPHHYYRPSGSCPTPGTVTATPTCVPGGNPTWRTEPSMTTARRNPGVAVVGTDLYAITGFNAAPDYTAVNERFDGTTWTARAAIPTPHAQARAAAVGTNIYVPGGYNSILFTGPLSSMQIYNTATNAWSQGAPLPAARSGAAVVAFNNKVYVIAGFTSPFPTTTNTVYEYDPATNTYATRAPMPGTGAGNLAGTVHNGEIYVIGGSVAVANAYNPTTNTWRAIAAFPQADCQSNAAFTFGGRIWTVGCLNRPVNQQVWVYDPVANTWAAGNPLYTLDHAGPGAALFNGRGYVVGGGAAGGGSAAVESIGGGVCPTGTVVATSTRTVTPTVTRTGTTPPSPTATTPSGTCTPVPAGWTDRAPITASPGLTRADAAYWPGNGNIYVFGGRPTDSPPGNYNQTIYVYNPTANSWSTAATTLTDTRVSNLQAAVLNGPTGPRIFLFGGSPSSGDPDPTPSNIVRVYDPATGTLTNSDPWPQNPTAVPGGGAVFNNKMYLFGGFDPITGGGQTLDTIWEFDPMAAAGSRWTLKSTHMSLDRGYIGTVNIGTYIYLAGGSQWDGSALTNETILERYDPAANTISTMAPIPTGSSNWSAYTDGTRLYAAGGFFSTAVNILYVYTPSTNSWATAQPMTHAVRNYASTQIGLDRFYAIGGYDSASTVAGFTQLYTPGIPCATPTTGPTSPPATNTPTATRTAGTPPPLPTNTPTRTNTPGTPVPPTFTPTACTLEFTDVPPTNTFYPFVRCLACKGIINGYPCGTNEFEPCDADNNPYFRPNNPVTRGQISKMISLSAGFNEVVPPTQQSFEDVVYGSPFWEYIERLYTRGIVGGYQCGINPAEPCIPPDDRPYFRPNAGATRGQLVKIASESAGFNDLIPETQYTFTDVEPGHTFWLYIERLLLNRPDAIVGYPCGGPFEPCDSENRPYFRPNNGVTRGQSSKIIANTFFPGCNPPLAPIDSVTTSASR